jgi:mitochondrial chaperone BCS1
VTIAEILQNQFFSGVVGGSAVVSLLYALNLGSIQSDQQLIDAASEVPEHAVLLIEDVDAASATAKREVREKSTAVPGQATEEPTPVSLSALLNVLDGVFARDGRILIMTTNHPENVDPALLRTGRADRTENIQPLEYKDAHAFCSRFMGDDEASRFLRARRTPVVASDLQERLLQYEGEQAEAAE